MISLYSYSIKNETEVQRDSYAQSSSTCWARSENSLSTISTKLKSLSTNQLANGVATVDLESTWNLI